MRTCETKAIQADLCILMHILASSSILQHIQAYKHIQELFRHIKSYSEPCATMVH